MIDHSKRKTLKTIVVATGSVAAGGVSASTLLTNPEFTADDVTATMQDLGQIEVSTRLSVEKNDLEVVLTNVGNDSVNITHMTPKVARVARGEFDFSALLKNGSLQLEAGESVTVPLQRKPVNVAAPVATLTDTLKNSISVITDSNSFASVSVMNSATALA